MKTKTALVVALAGAVALAATAYLVLGWYWYGSYSHGYPFNSNYVGNPYGYGPGMMGYMWGYGYPGVAGGAPASYINQYGYPGYYSFGEYPINKALTLAMGVPRGAQEFRGNDTIVFHSSNVTLVVAAMMGGDAENMTGSPLPSYSKGDVFVIYGLINPTIVVPEGAVIHVIFINLDDDMYHNFVVTAAPPPYPYYSMPYIARGTEMGPGMMVNMEWLPPANYGEGYAASYSYSLVMEYPGVYWYVCTYPGHAEEGMYGEIIVEPVGGR